ncbi:MAG: hypothetical protein OYH76_19025 [Defluviicoccus sp.]|nr:hypothetical protein [Defluviicoccus sp.]MDE0277993.1 hypothetical protein [Defluviicoccus sp.]
MGLPTGLSKPKQLLVEGNDQRNFFEALARHLGLADAVQICDFGGVDQLRGFLAAFVKMPDFGSVRSVGIVRDAEDSEDAAFRSVQSSLENANLAVPMALAEPAGEHPTATVLILPGDRRSGMLETVLCRTFVDEPTNRCIDDFFECVERLPDAAIDNPDKARAFAYLATKRNPHHSVGVAAKAGVWDLDHAAFDGVRDFLRGL